VIVAALNLVVLGRGDTPEGSVEGESDDVHANVVEVDSCD
jgi:hypothetical protein